MTRKSLRVDYNQNWSQSSSRKSQRIENSTLLHSGWIMLQILLWSQRAYSHGSHSYIAIKIGQHNNFNLVGMNAICYDRYLLQPEHWSLTIQGWRRMINILLLLVSCWSLLKGRSWKENALAEDHSNINHSDTWVIHIRTLLTTSLLKKKISKFKGGVPLTINKQKCC